MLFAHLGSSNSHQWLQVTSHQNRMHLWYSIAMQAGGCWDSWSEALGCDGLGLGCTQAEAKARSLLDLGRCPGRTQTAINT